MSRGYGGAVQQEASWTVANEGRWGGAVTASRRRPGLGQTLVSGFLLALAAAGRGTAHAAPPGEPIAPIRFDRAAAPGLRFVTRPSRTSERHQPESMISGVAVFDFDNDGLLDVFAVNGGEMPGLQKTGEEFHDRLFRNKGAFAFEDVTARAGVSGRGYNMGAAVADYDNDGFQDLFVAGLRANTLFRNRGDGTFEDVTTRAGLAAPDPEYGTLWGVAAAFLDYDRDGWLDLFVSNYCVWDPAIEPKCGGESSRDYCHPKHYAGLPNSLFRNNRDGTFTDVSVASGIRSHIGKGMGLGVADFDGDGWTDVFLSNDTVPNFFFRNERNGTFVERAFEAGVAATVAGVVVSGMGADAKDIDNDGRPDIFQTALNDETMPYYRNLGDGTFDDVTAATGLARLTRTRTGWSNGIYDLNNDGWKDLFAACGSVLDFEGNFRDKALQPNAVFVNQGNGTFADGTVDAGAEFAADKAMHRGAAFGDLDNDGRIDVVVTDLHGPITVWRNASPSPNNWLLVKTEGRVSNRDGIGAKLKVTTSAGTQHNRVNTAVGYSSASDRRVHFGLGRETVVKELTVTWPSGIVQQLRDVPANRQLVVREPER
jgi:hypothetical protein